MNNLLVLLSCFALEVPTPHVVALDEQQTFELSADQLLKRLSSRNVLIFEPECLRDEPQHDKLSKLFALGAVIGVHATRRIPPLECVRWQAMDLDKLI